MGEGYSGADLRLTIKNFQMGEGCRPSPIRKSAILDWKSTFSTREVE